MKIRENSSRPFDNSTVRKQYSAGKISVNDFQPFDEMVDLLIGSMLCPRFVSRSIAAAPIFFFRVYIE